MPLGHSHSPAMYLIVLIRGRTRKQNLRSQKGVRDPLYPVEPNPELTTGRGTCPPPPAPSPLAACSANPSGLAWPRGRLQARRAAPVPWDSLVAGAEGRPALHLVELVHLVLLQGEAGA